MSSCSYDESDLNSNSSHSDSTPALEVKEVASDVEVPTEASNKKGKEKVYDEFVAGNLPLVPKTKKRGRTNKVKRALEERSKVWKHFERISVPLIAEVKGVDTVVGRIQKGKYNYCGVEKTLFRMENKMRTKYKKYFGSIDDINQLFFIALVLDPRFKMKNLERVCENFLAIDREENKKKSEGEKELLISLCDVYSSNIEESSSSRRKKNKGQDEASSKIRIKVESDKSDGEEENDGVGALMDADWDKQLEGEEVVIGNEVDRYLLDPIEKPKENNKQKLDIYLWWNYNGNKYPMLQKIAKDVLAIQVSAVASESSFSTGKWVIDPHRSSMTPKSVEALICYQNWIKSDAIMGLEYTPIMEEMKFFE